MNEREVEESILRLKGKMEVNETLKRELRSSFRVWKRRRRLRRSAWISAAAAVALVFVFLFQPAGIQKVEAASLKIQNQVSFVDIGSGHPLGVSESGGAVYIPVEGKGLYVYDDQGFHRVTDRAVIEVKADPAGERLLLSDGESIGIYDLQSKEYTELLRGNGTERIYEQPSWKDNHTILYVEKVIEFRQTHGFDVKQSSINELNLNSGESVKITEGSFPSYSKESRSLVFQRDHDSVHQVVALDLSNGKETVIDEGRFPSVSGNGAYIAYVKSEQTRREPKSNVFVEENVDQVWISDLDGNTKRAVTRNIPNKTIDETEWLNQTESENVAQVLQLSGLYSYYNPSWGSDSQSLYVLKDVNQEGSGLRIMRIDFSEQTLEAEETVKAFNQARIRRDLDFARSLLRNDQDFLIVSNPHQVSYAVLGSGKEGEREYVDVEEYWAYTANPEYFIERIRYYVSDSEDGYLIDEMKKVGGLSVMEAPDGSIQVQEGENKRSLFAKEDIPKELLPEGEFRFASLAYIEKQNRLIFTVQALQDPSHNQKASVRVIGFDASQRTFQPFAHVTDVNGMQNIGISNMIVPPGGGYAALDLFSDDDPAFGSHLLVLDLQNNLQSRVEEQITNTQVSATYSYYWDGDELHFTLLSEGETMFYKWDAAQKRIERP
ncbi:TolB family protein [Paenibacillus thermotolerans]|uniref:TolB family protein n=1 Tax=Paenibacillus thermotolerans TaxID=3027807 RepID=UPI002368165D|nr:MULTISPECIES: hypothetical protein [unclassified Paenibacillus]